jgi:hypothetical protein
MSAVHELRSYLRQLRRRLRLGAIARGSAALTGSALAATVLLTVIINRFAFSSESLWSARALLLLILASCAAFGLAIPLWRLTLRRSARRAEGRFPQFEQRLLTFAERDGDRQDPFLELLADDTLRVARAATVKSLLPETILYALFGAGVGSLVALIWLIRAGPGYLGYGAAALWTGPGPDRLYDVRVTPGDATVRRHGDQLVTAVPLGVHAEQVRIHVRYRSSPRWEQVPMQAQPQTSAFQFLFAGVPEEAEYYVEAGSVRSRHFHLRVVDVPVVKQIRVTYHYPAWMNRADTVEENGGDLRGVEGTEAELLVATDLPLRNGVLALDDGRQLPLSAVKDTLYRGLVKLEADGSYHVAMHDPRQTLRISENYSIEASEVKPPEVAIVRPGTDYRATPIEEVTIAARAEDPYGISDFALRYSVNGGPEHSVGLLRQQGAQQSNGEATISLESLNLVPGDVVGFYAVAKDARSEARTDIAFVEVEPFEREYSQSQASFDGRAGGAGSIADNQAEVTQREKEIIAATWRRVRMNNGAAQEAAEQAKFLSDVQTTLRGQSLALAGRLRMRDLQLANEHFSRFEQEMAAAAAAMEPAAGALQQQQWSEAIPDEQKALQHLLRAEATFREIVVALGSAGGTGAVNSAGRDLASLFDLELDMQKNEYETGQRASDPNQQTREIDAALRKLDELARRQDELAGQRGSDAAQAAEQRWQQEMLRRQAEELQHQLSQIANARRQAGSGAISGSDNTNAQQALARLREAEEQMRRAVDQQDTTGALRAAQQLREATHLLSGVQHQQTSQQLDSLTHEAERLASEQRRQAERLRSMLAARGPGGASGQPHPSREAMEAFIDDRQRLADELARLTQQMHNAERTTLRQSRTAASKLRDAIGDLEQSDTETHLQRSADLLRRGYVPSKDSTDAAESDTEAELQHLKDQLGEARQSLADAQSPGDDVLDTVQRLRDRLASLERNLRGTSNSGVQASRQSQPSDSAQAGPSGMVAGAVGRGGYRGGPVDGAWNTGNNAELPRPVAPDSSPVSPEIRRNYQEGLHELGNLRGAVDDDPEAQRQVDELIRAMQKLDPRRFPGNPAMVDELYARVLSGVDKLELQLRQEPAENAPEEVRGDSPQQVPDGYRAAVADYYRRLSKNQVSPPDSR